MLTLKICLHAGQGIEGVLNLYLNLNKTMITIKV